MSYIIGGLTGIISGVNESHATDFNDDLSLSDFPLFDLQPHERFVTILRNNLVVSLKSMLLSTFSLGVLPIIFIFYNGFVFGCIIGRCLKIFQIKQILKCTLPHSFEFFGIIIYSYIGFVLSVYLLTKNTIQKINTLLYYLLLATAIILIAALIESYVSMS